MSEWHSSVMEIQTIVDVSWLFTGAQQFNSHKSVQKLFHNLHTIFSNPLMGFKVICQLEKEPLKGPANVQEIFF